MNIAYLVNTYPQPSHSFIRREIHALERRGISVHRFAMRGVRERLVDPGDLAEDDLTEHVLAAGVPRLLADTLREIARAPGRALAALRLAVATGRRAERGVAHHLVYFVEACHIAARCRTLGIDHLHAHFGTNSASVAMLARVLGGPDYSFTVHGPEEFDAPVALSLGDKMRHAAFTVAISSFGRSQLCRWSDLDGWDRIKVVHCGVEPMRFAAPAPMPGGSETRLVAIGRLVEQKGQLLLVEAMELALRAHPALGLTLVGDGELRGPIEAAIAARGLSERVTITGWLDEARVRAELATAHALVMPSFAEGLPMVVMEAMAAGRPVIATAIAGVPELVLPGETGWLVPAGDPEALARAMVLLAETPRERLAAMGVAGRNRALARHDIDREAGRLAGLMGFPAVTLHTLEEKAPPMGAVA